LIDVAAKVEEDAHDSDDDGTTAVTADGKPLCEVTSRVYFDVSVGGQQAGRIVVGLYGNAVPRTVTNFETLAEGDTVHPRGAKLSYAGSTFHRIIPNFMVRGLCVCVCMQNEGDEGRGNWELSYLGSNCASRGTYLLSRFLNCFRSKVVTLPTTMVREVFRYMVTSLQMKSRD
jgi:hypothetical protein